MKDIYLSSVSNSKKNIEYSIERSQLKVRLNILESINYQNNLNLITYPHSC